LLGDLTLGELVEPLIDPSVVVHGRDSTTMNGTARVAAGRSR
jgi:hypothetical protein